MPFRDPRDAHAIPTDPLKRFLALHAALDEGRRMWADRVPLRYAAITMLTTEADPVMLAQQIRDYDKRLRTGLGWTSGVDSSVRMLVAAQLCKYGDTPEQLVPFVEQGRALFRTQGLRRGGVYELLALLIMRRSLGATGLGPEHVARFKAIYAELKRHHWFLTGTDDYPACGILVTQPGTPKEIGEGTEALYQTLRKQAGLWRGEALQTTANVLYLSRLAPQEAARRFNELRSALHERGYRVRQRDYDEVAVLSFLATPADKIIDAVVGYQQQLRASLRSLDKSMAISLGASLTFVRLLGEHATLGPLADAKLLLDMQQIVAMRQGAAAAAAA